MHPRFRAQLLAHDRVFTREHVARGLVDDEAVAARVASGEWLHPHPRVYVASPVITPRVRLVAALAYADPAWPDGDPRRDRRTVAISCQSAAAELRLRWGGPDPGDVHVTTSATSSHLRDAPGVVVHRSGLLVPSDVVRVESVPVTVRARTLVDLARLNGHGTWADARAAWCHAAQSRRLTVAQLEAQAAAVGCLSQPRFAELCTDLRGRSESDLECQFGRFRRRYRIPAPTRQVWRPRALGGWARVDAEVEGVLVELLGLAFHLEAGSFEDDVVRRNDLNITLAGTGQICQEITYDAMRGARARDTAERLWLAIRTARAVRAA